MSVQAGKFFDVKKTKDYFDGMNISMDEYIKKSEIANAEYLNFFSTDAFRGKTAKAVKMLVKNRAGQMLDDAVKAQNLVKDSQDFTLSTFAAEVDPAPNARIEYNTLRNIETDFKGFHNTFKSIALSVDNIADRLNGEFGSYGYFGKPDSRPVLREYENFCGGDADNTGYLSECIGKLVRFDGMVNSYITSKQIDVHSTTVSARAKSVGAALMTPVAKSPKMAKYEIKTISTEPVPKSGGSKTNGQDAKYAELMKEYGFTEEEMEYLKEYYPNLLNTLYSAKNSSTRLEMRTYEKIKDKINEYNIGKLLVSIGWSEEQLTHERLVEIHETMKKYNITTKEEQCAFLAQCTHETGFGKSYTETGSDAYFAGKKYGKTYRGGGAIQITWDYGYKAFATYEILKRYPQLEEYGTYKNPASNGASVIDNEYTKILKGAEELNIDLSKYTQIVTEGADYVAENFAWESAGYFWEINNVNEKIENGASITEVSKIVNKYDSKSFPSREQYYESLLDNYDEYIS